MSRVFGEPVQVWTGGDGRPERFAWQGRVHTVRRVLDHWVRIRRSGGGPGRPGPHVSEQRFWRIDAGPEPGAGRFELCYDTLIDQWLLSRPWE
ncbi:DUF6504 family protein [Allonocardiopsis opalescens]|uniref:DUF6504 domain-containing protein n=1 Tax=Allonocardiopsis opalescens TaxID=1144618 RepID=A0A2T0Q0B4_9ACTN|nr:DUF6504 family protein [Allonocardiopsis opalescens]PRX97237.1 hypothetical protein CLV72_106273 [Allonocardiopsis opalescens]